MKSAATIPSFVTVRISMVPPKIKKQAKRNIRAAGKAATALLPKTANEYYIGALAREMLQQASTVYEPDKRSNGPDQQPQDE